MGSLPENLLPLRYYVSGLCCTAEDGQALRPSTQTANMEVRRMQATTSQLQHLITSFQIKHKNAYEVHSRRADVVFDS